MPKVIINSERCKGCALCVDSCPKKCLVMSRSFNKLGYHYAEFANEKDCTTCGFCYQICPDVCIEVTREK